MPTKLAELQAMLSVAFNQPVLLCIGRRRWIIGDRGQTLLIVIPSALAKARTKHELLFMIVRGIEKAVAA